MINVTLGEAKPQMEKPFPKLMQVISKEADDFGTIVLFLSSKNGTVVYTTSHRYYIGYNCCTWIMDRFTDYNEPITLQNA